MPKDIEMMRWIQEQKFMTVEQIRRVFWKNPEVGMNEAYRRLLQLQGEGYLKRCRSDIYRYVLYMVSRKGKRLLRMFGEDRGLKEIYDVEYATYMHDVVVTDIRIMFHTWGYSDWASERVIAMHERLRRIPDGMLYHRGKGYAIEYESTQKSKSRYKDIFLEYDLERKIDKVVYVVREERLAAKLCNEARNYDKFRFVALCHLKEFQLNARVQGNETISGDTNSNGGTIGEIFNAQAGQRIVAGETFDRLPLDECGIYSAFQDR